MTGLVIKNFDLLFKYASAACQDTEKSKVHRLNYNAQQYEKTNQSINY